MRENSSELINPNYSALEVIKQHWIVLNRFQLNTLHYRGSIVAHQKIMWLCCFKRQNVSQLGAILMFVDILSLCFNDIWLYLNHEKAILDSSETALS